MIPDKLSAQRLESLLQNSQHPGKEVIESTDYRQIAVQLIQQLEAVNERLENSVPDNALNERWKYTEKARRQIKLALRCLTKSIQC